MIHLDTRQGEGKTAALAGGTLHFDIAAVALGDHLDEAQPQARATGPGTPAGAGPAEALRPGR